MSDSFEKKSERLEIRLPYSKKQAFIDACEDQSDTPSSAIRRFIDTYVRRNNRDNFSFGVRSLKRVVFRPIFWAGVTAVAVSALMIWNAQPSPIDQKTVLFSEYDQNADQVLDASEINLDQEQMKILLSALDNDGSKNISLEEFRTHGDIVITHYKKGTDTYDDNSMSVKDIQDTKLVTFDLNNRETPMVAQWNADANLKTFSADVIKFVPID